MPSATATDDLQPNRRGKSMTSKELVHRSHNGLRAWCLCPDCSAKHASKNKRRTKHDRWALDGQDWRIHDDLARQARGDHAA